MKKLFKKAAAILMATILMIPATSSMGYVKAADTKSVTVLVNEDFEGTGYSSAIQSRGSGSLNVNEQTGGNHELTISGRTSDWNGIQIPVDVVSGGAITVSMKVRSTNTECVLGIQYVPSGSTSTEYKWIKNLATTEASYVDISGTYDIPSGAKDIKLYLQGNGAVALENIMVDDILVTVPNTGTEPSDTVIENFEGDSNTAIARSATLAVVDGSGVDGSRALLVSGRTQTWQGVNFDGAKYAGQTIIVSAQVKSTSPTMKISLQTGEGDNASYNTVAQGNTGISEYVTLSGSYTIPSGKSPIYLYIEAADTSDFYVDNFTISVNTKPGKVIQENLLPLREYMASDSSIAGKMGVAIPSSALVDDALMKLVTKHFSSITCENEMKPDSILGSSPTLDADGNLVLNFTNPDKVMDYILNYNQNHPDDIIRVRGHVLLWHSQTPSWFFKENYEANGAYVSKEEMVKRMDYYIKNVMAHFDGQNSKYKGIIYAWDVVNEQIDNGGIRQNDGSNLSNWYQVFHGDNDYIIEAFRLANQYAPSDVKLFYNDYGETDSSKVVAICKLINDIKAAPGTRIDGMGMQGHYNMLTPSIDDFEKAVRAYAAIVDEIQITELDLQSSNDYDGTNQEAEYTKQAYRYKAIFDKIKELDHEDGIDITAVTMWGTHDGASWLNSSSSAGGGANGTKKQCPLLFDDDYQAKPAYYAIVDPSQLEPITNTVLALCSEKDNWAAAPKTTYSNESTEVTFQTLWNTHGIKVQVQVKDTTVSDTDKIAVYMDTANSKSSSGQILQYTLARSDAVVTADGYKGIITIPLSNVKVGEVIGYDIAVINDGAKLSWNDLRNTQETTSKYYGELTLKPYEEFNYGTPTIDGSLDSIWNTQNTFPLTVKTGTPLASGGIRALWDNNYLYVYADITDPNLSKTSTNAWEQDSLEIFLDQNNNKTTSFEGDDCQYRINFNNEASFNGTKCNADNLKSATKLTDHGYVIEAAIKWTDIVPVNGSIIGVDFQINDDTGTGSRSGLYNWYDNTGTGYANPSVFGTATLIKTNSGDNGNGGNNSGNPNNGGVNVNNGASGTGDITTENTDNNNSKDIKVAEKTLNEAAKDSPTISNLLKDVTVKGTFVSVVKTSSEPKKITISAQDGKAGDKTYIYRVNDTTGKLETIAYGYSHRVDKDGRLDFTVYESGNFVVLTKKLDNSLIASLKNQIKVTIPKSMKTSKRTSVKVILPACLELTQTLGAKTSSEEKGAVVVSYKVSDTYIASINKDGLITAKKAGKITVITTIKLYNNTCKIIKTFLTIKK